MKTTKLLAATLILWCMGFAAAIAEPSAAMKAVAVAAQKEGRLDLSWGGGLLGGDVGLAQLTKLMNATYGTSIDVRFIPGQSFPQTGSAIVTTWKAKQFSPTDAYIGTNQHLAVYGRTGIFQPIDWPALLPGRVDPSWVEADGTALRVATVIPGGIIYNTKLAPNPPTKLVDLLKPEWKGKIGSTPYAASFDLLSADGVWGEKGLQFARDLSAQLAGLLRCNELERVASGEFIAMAMDCTGRDWVKAQEKGAPIGFVVPADFAAIRYYYLAVPKNAEHPNAAQLFIATVVSPEGQEILFRTSDIDLHNFPASGMSKVIGTYETKGIKFQEFTVQWWNEHPETDERTRQAVQIISRK